MSPNEEANEEKRDRLQSRLKSQFYQLVSRKKNQRTDLSWSGITYKRDNKVILNNVTGRAKSGTVNVIIGHSGTGKTTLLDILTGRIKVSKAKTLEGTVRANGQVRDENWRHLVAFSEQHSLAYQNLSIDEILQFQADLKLGNDFTYAEKRAIIDYLVHKLDMESIRHFRIYGLLSRKKIGEDVSKRISIACLILELPAVAILDEPTTGMDSTQAEELINLFKELCDKTGMTVIISIKHPSAVVLDACSTVSLLGYCHVLFNGNPDACIEHFKQKFNLKLEHKTNHFSSILKFIKAQKTEQDQELLINSWNESVVVAEFELQQSSLIESSPKYPLSYWREFCLLYSRYIKFHYREKFIMIGEICQTIILSLLIAFCYFQLTNLADDILNIVSLFYYVTACVFASVGIPMSIDFEVDKDHLERERASGSYRMSAAYFAKFFSVLPFAIALMLLFSIPIYFICGLSTNPFTKFLTYLAILFALRLLGLTLRLFISAAFDCGYSIAIFLPSIVIFFVLFGDLKAESGQITWILAWLKYISPLFYSVQALMQNEFKGNTYQSDLDENLLVDDAYYLDKYGFQNVGIWYCFIALMGFALLYFVLGYIILRNKTKTNHVLI